MNKKGLIICRLLVLAKATYSFYFVRPINGTAMNSKSLPLALADGKQDDYSSALAKIIAYP
jgi:hypothetical protein